MFYKDKSSIKSYTLNTIPSYIKSEYPRVVKLIEHFLDFMEQEGKPLHGLEHLKEHNRKDSPYNKFWDKIYEDSGFDFHDDLVIDKRQFYNYLMDFYMSRGSIKSLKFLISVLYNDEITVEYPRDNLFIPSQADYTYNQFIVCKIRNLDANMFRRIRKSIDNFSLTVVSNSSGDKLDVENAFIFLYNQHIYLNLKVNYKYVNKFMVGEQITLIGDGFEIIGSNVPIIKFNIEKRGYGYKVGDKINVSNTVNDGFVTVSHISTGSIKSIKIVNGGKGYKIGDYLYSASSIYSTGGGFYAEVSEVGSNGEITAIKIYSNGSNYSSIPNIGVVSKTGSKAIFEAISNDIGGILGFEYKTNFAVDINEKSLEDTVVSIETENGVGAKLNLELNVVNNTSSYYRNHIGFVSDKSYITDSLYYQQYCYKVVSETPRYIYDDAVDELTHPSGYMRYAGFKVINYTHKLDNDKPTVEFNLIKKVTSS